MRKEFFDTLYKEVQTIDIKTCDDVQLRALFSVYSNVHFLVFTTSRLSSRYGNLKEIKERLKMIGEELTLRMNTLSEASQVQCLNVLLELFALVDDREREDQILEKAYLLLESTSFNQEPAFEVSLCHLACKCYYLIPEEEQKERLEKTFRRWSLRQSGFGLWEDISPLLAIQRLLAMDAYHTVTSDAKFHACFRRGTDAYLNHAVLPRHGAGCNEEQILVLCNMILLNMSEIITLKNDVPEQIEKVIEEYLGGYVSHGKKLYSEEALSCISVLTACLQRECDLEYWRKAL